MRVQGTGPVDATLCCITDTPRSWPAVTRMLKRHLPNLSVFLTALNADYAIELKVLRPQVLVTVGLLATQRFLGEVKLGVVHGLPHQVPVGPGWVFPCYEPTSTMEAAVTYDFTRLAGYLQGEVPVKPKNHYVGTYHYASFAHNISSEEAITLATVGTPDEPWGVAYAQRYGEARVLRRGCTDALKHYLDEHREIVLFHSLQELPVLRALGIELPGFIDVSLYASLLGESVRLPTLAYRYCGMGLATTLDAAQATVPAAVHFAGQHADALLRVYPLLHAQLVARGLMDTAERDLAVLLKLDLLRQAGEFVDLTSLALASSSVWPEDD